MKIAQQDCCHLVICRYPLPDMKLREFVTAIRAVGSASKSCSLLLLTIPEMATEARSGVQGGPFLVFSGQEPLGSLGHGAAHLLQVAPRNAPRISTRLRAGLDDGSETFEGWVVNLSRTGMLVKESPMLPIGSTCFFDFTLPGGESIRGRAEVVRHAKPRRERVTGFAVRSSAGLTPRPSKKEPAVWILVRYTVRPSRPYSPLIRIGDSRNMQARRLHYRSFGSASFIRASSSNARTDLAFGPSGRVGESTSNSSITPV